MLLYSVRGDSLSSITLETVILEREGNINMRQMSNTALMSQQSWSCLILRIYSQTEEKVNKEKVEKGKLRMGENE